MASRRSKKNNRNKDRLPKRLFKRVRGPVIPPGSRVVYEPTGREKMSEVLDDFIEPYQEVADNEDSYRKLLNLAVLAWNAALLPEDQRRTAIDETLKVGLPGSSKEDRAAGEGVHRDVDTAERGAVRHEPAGDPLLRADGYGRRIPSHSGVYPLRSGWFLRAGPRAPQGQVAPWGQAISFVRNRLRANLSTQDDQVFRADWRCCKNRRTAVSRSRPMAIS